MERFILGALIVLFLTSCGVRNPQENAVPQAVASPNQKNQNEPEVLKLLPSGPSNRGTAMQPPAVEPSTNLPIVIPQPVVLPNQDNPKGPEVPLLLPSGPSAPGTAMQPPAVEPSTNLPIVIPQPVSPSPVIPTTGPSDAMIKPSDDVVLYGNENCGYCNYAKELLNKKGINFTFKDVNKNPQFRNDIQPYGGGKYPFVFINGTFIGHLPELQDRLNGVKSTPPSAPTPTPVSTPALQPPVSQGGVPAGFTSPKNVVLYGNQKTCGLCHEAERLLKAKGIDYDFKDVFDNTSYLVYLHNNIGSHRFPYVYINGQHIGGLEELQAWLAKQ